MTDYDPTVDCLRRFTTALPYYARRHWTPNWRTIAAVRACAERGDNLDELAATCACGLARRTRDDVRKLLTFRLLRAAGMDDIDEGTTR